MPLPLIPIAIGVVALLASTGVGLGVAQIAKKFGNKSVAILGQQGVGKSTLLHFLEHGAVKVSVASRTVDAERGADFSLDINDQPVTFTVRSDIPGHPGAAFLDWQAAFRKADYVLYLFHADRVLDGDAAELSLIDSHMGKFKAWSQTKKKGPQVVLVGLWTDQLNSDHDVKKATRAIADAEPIKFARVKLRGAQVVIGSLVSDDEAKELVTKLGRALR